MPEEKKPQKDTTTLATPPPQDASPASQKLALLNMDISQMTVDQRPQYLAALAQSMGLNPLLKPFDVIPGDKGKLIVYANAGCADQIADGRKLSRTLVYAGPLCVVAENAEGRLVPIVERVIDDTLFLTLWRVRELMTPERGDPWYRETYDCGVSYTKEALGSGKATEIAKTFTKGQRRATLGHASVGFPDASEVESIPTLMPTGPKIVMPADQRPALPPAQVTTPVGVIGDASIVTPPPPPVVASGAPPAPRKPPAPPVPPKPQPKQ